MQHDFVRRAWLFGALILIAVALPGAFTVWAFNDYRHAAAAVTRAQELRGEIRRLDEVLTMSARMAATSGEERWIERYDAHVGPLEAAIGEMLELSGSQNVADMVDATNAANTALVDMETRSFGLVRGGQSRSAYALLMSGEYEQQKTVYAQGMNQAMAALDVLFARDTARSGLSLLIASLLSILGVSACFFTWMLLMRKSFREHERLHLLAEAERDTAKAANAAKSMFLASMSHELRTPLNAVIGYSEMLREGAEENRREGDMADHDKVIAAARRLLTLIDDLLDLSKAEAGKIVVKPRTFDVRTLIDSTAATIAPAVAARGNRLTLDIADDIGASISDEFRLGQCLLNLLSNAAKFTRDGDIALRASREDDMLVFEVADTGVGMSPDQLRELFQPFVQVEAVVAQAHGGTGLGLAITRQLARLLGGDVSVRSTESAGTVFTLAVAAVLGAEELNLAAAPELMAA